MQDPESYGKDHYILVYNEGTERMERHISIFILILLLGGCTYAGEAEEDDAAVNAVSAGTVVNALSADTVSADRICVSEEMIAVNDDRPVIADNTASVSENDEGISENTVTESKPLPHMIYLGPYGVMSDTVELDLSGRDLSGLDVGGFIDKMPYLENLRLQDCGLSNEECASLQDAQPDVFLVWDIKIGKRKIPTDSVGFSTLIGWKGYPRLTDKDTRYFKYLRKMVALDLGHNYISDLSFLEYMPDLKVLILVDNYPDPKSYKRLTDISEVKYCKKLRYLEIFANSIEDISALQELKELEDLNICHNPIGSAEYIRDLPNLKKLWVYSTKIPSEELKELREIYPDTKRITSGSGSVDQGWRSGEHYKAMRNMVINNVMDPVYEDN